MLTKFINTIKYSKDDPMNYDIKIEPSNDIDYNSNPDAYLLTTSMQIKNDLFPKIYQSINEVKEILQLDDIYNFYVNPDNSSANAYCKVMPRSDRADIIFTSRLIELLDVNELKFIVAHEIAHHQYQHYLYPNPKDADNQLRYFNLINLQKNAEISSDRLGFTVLGDLEQTMRAMIKISSGLSSEHIKYNFDNFMNQLEDLKKLETNPYLMNSSHPSIFTRAQAVLWYSQSNEFTNYNNNFNKGLYDLHEVDLLIDNAITDLISRDQDQVFGDRSRTCLFWCMVYLILVDKKFTKTEQEYLSSIFSNQKVISLKSFLINASSDEIEKRMKSELHRSIDLPKAKKNEIKDKLKEYIERFSSDNNLILVKAYGKILGILE
jgi:hypothetical protein